MDIMTNFSNSFIIAYIAGLIFLLLFCVDRFDQPVKNGSFVETLVPRHLATHAEYLRTFLIYYIIMWVIYTLLTLMGPSILLIIEPETEGLTKVIDVTTLDDPWKTGLDKDHYPPWFPLAVVLVLAGAASSRYPFFNTIELIVRRLTHRIIGIPEGIQNLAEKLNRARIDLTQLSPNDIDFIKTKYTSVTHNELENISDYYTQVEAKDGLLVKWIRLQFLFNTIENKQRDLPEGFDTAILRSYKGIWDQIKSATYALSPKRIADSMISPGEEADDIREERNRRTRDEVDNTLHDLHAVIAACVAQKAGRRGDLTDIVKTLKLDLKLDQYPRFSQAFIVAFVFVFIFVFLGVFFTAVFVENSPREFSEHMPSDRLQALSWATSTVFLHGAAAIAVLRFRMKRGRNWQRMRIRAAEIPATQYVQLMLLAYFAATAGLAIWWFLKMLLTAGFTLPSRKEFWIPLFGLMGMATGFWVSYSMDVAERKEAVPKIRFLVQAVLQSITTGLLCFLLLDMMPGLEMDFELYAGTLAALSGLFIGIIVIVFIRQMHLNIEQQDALPNMANEED